MALLPTWEQHNYEQNIRKISTKQYKEMVNDIRDMLWPHRDKIEDVGNIYTYVPFAKSVSGQDIELQCSIHYDNGQLNMKFQSAYGFCEPMFEAHVSKKLFGLRTESLFYDELYKFSPEYVKTTIKQVVESFTKEEKAEMFREANLKSLPDTFIYDVSMAEHCQMMSLDEIRNTIDFGSKKHVIYLNGGKLDILHAHEYRCYASECEVLKNSDDKIAVFDNHKVAEKVLNIMVPGKYIKPVYVDMIPTPLTAHTCESFTDVADQITQGIEEFDDFKKGLVDLGDMLMEQ